MLLGWVTILALDFQCALPPYGPPNQSGGIQVNQIFPGNHVGTQGLALGGDRCWLACPRPFKMFTFERRENSCDTHFGITYKLRSTQRRSNTIIHTGDNIGIISSSNIGYAKCYKLGNGCEEPRHGLQQVLNQLSTEQCRGRYWVPIIAGGRLTHVLQWTQWLGHGKVTIYGQ